MSMVPGYREPYASRPSGSRSSGSACGLPLAGEFGFLFGLSLGARLLHHPAREDRGLVQDDQRYREARLADDIRRRQYRGNDEHGDDGIASFGCEPGRSNQTHPRHQSKQHRQLKGDAKSKVITNDRYSLTFASSTIGRPPSSPAGVSKLTKNRQATGITTK